MRAKLLARQEEPLVVEVLQEIARVQLDGAGAVSAGCEEALELFDIEPQVGRGVPLDAVGVGKQPRDR